MDKTKDFLVGIFTFILILSITNCFAKVLDIVIVNFEISKWISLITQAILYIAVLIYLHILLRRDRFKVFMNTKLLVLAAFAFYFLNSYLLSFISFDFSYMYENIDDYEAKLQTVNLMGLDYANSGFFKLALLVLFGYHLLMKRPVKGTNELET